MDETASPSVAPARPEPRGANLLDLVLLVAGFGLYWVLPSFGTQPGQVHWLKVADDMGRWYEATRTLLEMMERTGFVLAIIAFTRRVQLGGVAKPGEFLFAILAMYWPFNEASIWAAFRTLTAVVVASIALSLSATALVRWRKRLPGWTSTTLIVVAYVSMKCVLNGTYGVWHNLDIADELPVAVEFAIDLPFTLFFNAPYAVAFGDAWVSYRRLSSFEWSGIVLATGWILVVKINSLANSLLSDSPWYDAEETVVSWPLDLVGLVITFYLARRLAPAVRDWFAPA